ncbi:hypothetical protein QTO34_012865 [Cnephaeus nilssonii]|uniref:Uncharacterized protein n=1 Tax=Cnephaeus nilssonii TaxID=3371016 RepID=A0AA40LCK8_CNENI|nr:hypothetical protein QTO34_012865 [Eptesicus nilssonii]
MTTHAAREDLRETPLENPELILFTDGRSFVEQGVWKAGYVVVTFDIIMESAPLSPETGAPLAELSALTRTLETQVCRFGRHAPVAIWEERHFLTANGSPIQYHKEIGRPPSAVSLPLAAAIIHCRGHQKGMGRVSEGSRKLT